MKYLLPVFLLVWMCFSANCQEKSLSKEEALTIANALQQYSLLNKRGVKELKKGIEEHHPQESSQQLSKGLILEFLAEVYHQEFWYRLTKKPGIEKRIKQEDKPYSGDFSGVFPLIYKAKSSVPRNRSTAGLTRTRTLEELKQIGLVDEQVYAEAKTKLLDQSIYTEFELLNFLAERTRFYNNYPRLKKEQLDMARKLAETGLLSPSALEKLKNSYRAWELREMHEILGLSPRSLIFDLSTFEPNPQLIYPALFKALQQLIPSFNYQNLKVEMLTENDFEEAILYLIRISFEANGKLYSHQFYHDTEPLLEERENQPVRNPNKISSDFHKGVNKYLADIGSRYRLHTFDIPDQKRSAEEDRFITADQWLPNRTIGQEKVGLILLTEAEADLLTADDLYFLSEESYDPRFTSEKVRNFLNELNQVGLFNHLSEEELQSARECLLTLEVSSYTDVLLCYPKTLIVFDWETGNLENPYEELTLALSRASRGAFTPTQIVDGFGKPTGSSKRKKKVPYGFLFNGKRYETMLTHRSDWLDHDFYKLIQKALLEQQARGSFYHVYSDGQISGYLFLSQEQHDLIRQKYPDLLETND